MAADKKKILFISDHQLVPSGVGTQARYLIEGLLATGKYKFVCLGGAVTHPNYTPQKVAPEKYGDDWLIHPVNGYGDKDLLRRFLTTERPDVMFIFTDPRFFTWVWEMEDEIRSVCPLVYWHVWDNDPAPMYNRNFYDSTDFISAISLKTYGLLEAVGYDREKFAYIPHALPADLFKPLPEEEIAKYKHDHFGPHKNREFVVFWNNRNARRKVTGDVIGAFAKFAKAVGRDRVALMMHTNVGDIEGQDIQQVAKSYQIDNNLIVSENRLPAEELNRLYNVVDCTINIASNEGFGIGTLESLYAGTPIVVHMTGGLQFQVGDWWQLREGKTVNVSDQEGMTELAKRHWRQHLKHPGEGPNWWGAPVFSASRSCTGSQQVPYIYDDRVNHDDVVTALEHVFRMSRPVRRELGLRARSWAIKNFNMDRMVSEWDDKIQKTIIAHGNKGQQSVRTTTI